MACGNNMVVYSGLQSPPTPVSHPTTVRAAEVARPYISETAGHADQQVTRAQAAIKQSTSITAVETAVIDAEKVLSAARRQGRSKEAKTALKGLERHVEQLREDASAKATELAAFEHHQREHQARLTMRSHDHMSPRELGVIPRVTYAESGAKGTWNKDLNEMQPNETRVVDNRAIYEADPQGRIVRAVTVLDQLAADTDRNPTQQAAAGGADRLATDDGGHVFATLFGGFGEAINVQAMDRSINRGAYLSLERLWAEQIRAGGQVHLEVTFHFPDNSRRPDRFDAKFDFGDGDTVSIPFYQ